MTNFLQYTSYLNPCIYTGTSPNTPVLLHSCAIIYKPYIKQFISMPHKRTTINIPMNKTESDPTSMLSCYQQKHCPFHRFKRKLLHIQIIQ